MSNAPYGTAHGADLETTMSDDAREYRTEKIAVLWDAERCIHSANCVRGLPRVFNPMDRPWVHIEAADAEGLAAVILTCPSGALHFRRLDGGAEEPVPSETTVQTVPDGPLYVRGDITVRDSAGAVIRTDTRMALCRCGASAHKPFCDNSHVRTGFRDSAPG